MMKLQTKWLLGGVAALLVGTTACQKANNTVAPEPVEGTTYMSVAINLSQNPAELLRAGEENNEHNPVGNWAGRDKINGVDIYIVDDATGTVVTKGLNVLTPPAGTGATAETDGVYATGAWKVKPGQKTLYVVVNNSDPIKETLKNAAASGKDAFETAYRAAYDYKFSTSTYAKVEDAKDVILMSGEPKTVNIKDNITQAQATIQTPGSTNENNNQFALSVRRSAARVAVTYDNEKLPSAKGKVEAVTATSPTTTTTVLGNISVEGWYYGQFEKQTKLLWDATATDMKDAETFLNRTTKSPSWGSEVTETNKADRATKYDYSTLVDGKRVNIDALTSSTKTIANIIEKGNMQFLTETTHQYGTKENTGYRKGNTPYVLIETVFSPADASWASTDEKDGYATSATKNLYYSTYNGKFYSNEDNAKKASTANAGAEGSNKDGVVTYKGGKMYYYAWLNPDTTKPTTWFNSPVLRNNIYHIHVTGFKKLGMSGDPFNPTDTNDKPVDPDDNVPSVTETLNTEETWMACEITVVNWGVHSYDIGF